MIRKILIGILIILGIAVAILNHLILGILAIGVWIYLFMMIRKQKKSVSSDKLEPKISDWHLKRIKAFLIVAVCSFLVFIVGAIVHNVFHGLYETEESVFLIISLVALFVFIAATAGGLYIFLKGRKNNSTTSELGE